jgi:hypothetical protein
VGIERMAPGGPFGLQELAERMVSWRAFGRVPARPRAAGVPSSGDAWWPGRRLNGDLSAGAVCWRGPASPGFRLPAFRCSTGPGPQGVFEDSAHMMFAGLPDLHLAGQIYVTRGHLVVPGPGGDECGRRLVDEWDRWGAADHRLTAASAVGFVWGW